MKFKVNIYLTADEFRELLPIYSTELQKLFDKLVEKLVESGLPEEEAKVLVAREMLKTLKTENLKVEELFRENEGE